MNNLKQRALTISTIFLASASFIATSPPFEDFCDNRIDDDGDGLVDLADDDCQQLLPREPVCGDGFRESDAGEACDDGNNISGDGCRADCRGVEVCGDGLSDPLNGEVCDDGQQSVDVCADDCSASTGTLFTTTPVNINGTNPSNANVVAFGEASVGTSGMLFLVASSDPNLCGSIEAATATDDDGNALTGFEAYFLRVLRGEEANPTVFLSAERLADNTAFSAPDVLVGDAERLIVDGGFIVGDGAQAIADTLFGGGAGGALSLSQLDATSIVGQYEGQLLFEFVSGQELDAQLRGVFAGTRCQAIQDGLPGVFGQ